MWRTECGERILEGAEAIVFAETLSTLLDDAILSKFEDCELGVTCFDNLTYGQKVSVLAIIGDGLFRKDVPPVEDEVFETQFEHFMSCIQEHKTPDTDVKGGIKVLEMLEAMYKSGEAGRAVSLVP